MINVLLNHQKFKPFHFNTSKILKILFLIFILSTGNGFAAQVTLTWDTNSEQDTAGYKIYYGSAQGDYSDSVDIGNTTQYTITNLEEDQTYYFTATAYDISSKESDFSNEISYYVPVSISEDQDSDGDGLTDLDEINIYATDPNNADTDSDGLTDGEEINQYVTDPINPDSDGDGILDGDINYVAGVIEAEEGVLTSPMVEVFDTEASGGAYIESQVSDAGTAEYTFTIESDGMYKIIAMVKALDAGSDSFYVQVDEGQEFVWDLNPGQDEAEFNVWREDEVTARGNGTYDNPEYDPYLAELSAGLHTLKIRGRETSAQIDYFYFEKVADIATPIIEAETGSLLDPMTVVSDESVSGGAYIQSQSSDAGSAEYVFTINTEGVYKMIAMVNASNSASDSFLVQIDNMEAFIWDLNPTKDRAEFDVWREDEVTNRGNGTYDAPEFDPYTVSLEAGEHSIVISCREKKTKLDYFYFEKQ
jgi:hypothetical protein